MALSPRFCETWRNSRACSGFQARSTRLHLLVLGIYWATGGMFPDSALPLGSSCIMGAWISVNSVQSLSWQGFPNSGGPYLTIFQEIPLRGISRVRLCPFVGVLSEGPGREPLVSFWVAGRSSSTNIAVPSRFSILEFRPAPGDTFQEGAPGAGQ